MQELQDLIQWLEQKGFTDSGEEGKRLDFSVNGTIVSVDFGVISPEKWVYHLPDRALVTLYPLTSIPPDIRWTVMQSFGDWLPIPLVKAKVEEAIQILS